jgi:mannose-6-phosphate isomerase
MRWTLEQNSGIAEWYVLRNWLTDTALPLWRQAGFDAQSASFFERLSLSGQPVRGIPRRVMVQARQMYVFTKALKNGWLTGPSDFLEHALGSMLRNYHEADGQRGWAFSVSDSGKVVDDRRDFYAHAFLILALAEAYSMTGDRDCLRHIDEIILLLEECFRAGEGMVPAVPGPADVLLQNPHMHYFEALLAAYEASGLGRYLDKAQALAGLLENRLLQQAEGIIPERFDRNWVPMYSSGCSFEPGHQHEWAWLLAKYFTHVGRELPDYVCGLRIRAEAGRSASGLIWSEVAPDGMVLAPTFRLWPHTEAIKSALQLESGQQRTGTVAQLLGLLHAHFLTPAVPGGWHDLLDDKGNLLVDYIPASSLYHIVCAASECEAAFRS